MAKVSYKGIGLVTTRDMFDRAMKGKYAIPAYNFNNMEQLQAIVMGCVESRSPFILQVSSGARKYANQTLLRFLAMGAVAMIEDAGSPVKFSLHLDHGDTFELCTSCIDSGFSSVMIDGSHHSYEDNVKLTRQVVEYAHAHDVVVEGELGVLAGIEDAVVADKSTYTKPEQVEDFVKKTGVDSLAISIGTSHGAMKFKPEQCTRDSRGVLVPPPLRFDILEEIEKRIPHRPARRLLGDPRICSDHQLERGQAQGRRRHSRGPAPQGGPERRLQGEHRQRRPARDDRLYQEGPGGEAGRVRPPEVSRPGPR